VCTDPAAIDVELVQRYLAAGRQSPGVPLDVVRAFVANSVNFGLFAGPPEAGAAMLGYARVVTDFAAFAYLGDVFLVDEEGRGQGWGSWMMDCIFAHPDLQDLRRWMLMCGERPVAWYKRYGFEEPGRPGFALHRTDRAIYLRKAGVTGEGSG
jgi:GNAT superfamily N-acetyltransferase